MTRWVYRFLLAFFSLLIILSTTVPSVSAQSSVTDLALSKTADRKKVKIGQNITFTIRVTNLGPDTATDIFFGDSLPDPLNFVSANCEAFPPTPIQTRALTQIGTITMSSAL